MPNCLESNEVLKLKFQKLHKKIVNDINPATVINFLFQEAVISADDTRALLKITGDPQLQCGQLLAKLHTSGNRNAFVKLYLAIKEEKSLEWLVEEIDKFTDQTLINIMVELYVSEPTGKIYLKIRQSLAMSADRAAIIRRYVACYKAELTWTCCLCTVGQVVHTLPEGRPVLGIAILAGEIYLLRGKVRDQVEVYDVISYRLQRCLTVPTLKDSLI